MARKLRTGFELPFSNSSGNSSRTLNIRDSYLWNGIIIGGYQSTWGTQYATSTSLRITDNITLTKDTTARTLSDGTRGSHLTSASDTYFAIDLTKFSNGAYCNAYICPRLSSSYLKLGYFYDGTDKYEAYVNSTGATDIVTISKNSTDVATFDTGAPHSVNTWYNYSVGVDNTGTITVGFNGSTPLTYNTSVSFANWNFVCLFWCGGNRMEVDDLAINDGSGASDNSTPNSIRGYNFFDAATLNTNSGFSAVGGTTVLANLQDGSDSTRVSASADLSYIDFSLPTLSGTGMSETAANFTKIEAINVYGRQIEATKASSLLKAKVTDTVAVVNREENLSLPLNVGNDSVSMFDDGSSDWVLANLDSGDMDFRVTFDKP